jgi:hypothetical protein
MNGDRFHSSYGSSKPNRFPDLTGLGDFRRERDSKKPLQLPQKAARLTDK